MRLLLDTHTFLWAIADSGRLSDAARQAFLDADNTLVLSAASAWEIAIKASLGRLELARPLEQTMRAELSANSIGWHPIEENHCTRVATLPFHHRDPFDRMLVAQSLEDGLPLVSVDGTLDAYGIQRIW